MPNQTKKTYYKKRQIIDLSLVSEEDYTDNVLLCVPRFAWGVARSFLAHQGGWLTTFATEYSATGYTPPTAEEMDTIQASIALFLKGEDMCENLTTAMQAIADSLENMNQQMIVNNQYNCGTGCGGSAGAGVNDPPPTEHIDDGVNHPPGFVDRAEYLEQKCKLSSYAVEAMIADLETIKDIDFTEITAQVLALLLLTPIGLTSFGVAMGVLTTYFLEQTLDGHIDGAITPLTQQRDYLKCLLYESVSADDALYQFGEWTSPNMPYRSEMCLAFFINSNSFNRLFEPSNMILPDADCSGCEEAPPACYPFEADGSVMGWYISDYAQTASLTYASGAMLQQQEGDGVSRVVTDSPHGIGYVVDTSDIWYISTSLVGGQVTLRVSLYFTDGTRIKILEDGTQNPYSRRNDQIALLPHAGKVIDYYQIHTGDSQTGQRSFYTWYCCLNAPPPEI